MSEANHVVPEGLVSKSGFFKGMNALMAILSMVMILGFVGFTIQDVEYSAEVFTMRRWLVIRPNLQFRRLLNQVQGVGKYLPGDVNAGFKHLRNSSLTASYRFIV